jgi:hypothetical protein
VAADVETMPAISLRLRRGTIALATTIAALTLGGLLLGLPAAADAASSGAGQFVPGVDLTSGFYDTSAVTEYDDMIGQPAGIVQAFVSWDYPQQPSLSQFPTSHVKAVIGVGGTPEITWDPTVTGGTSADPTISFADIAAGDYDSYITSFAEAAKSVDAPVMIRFAQEMNGAWTTYYLGDRGDSAAEFIAAWRHIHDIFAAVGATNVGWIWSPNLVAQGDSSLSAMYPGDAYVDWVGIDGYSYPLEGCTAPAEIFGPAVREIQGFTSKPMMLAEVAISGSCAQKPTLIANLFSWLETQPGIDSFVWWDRVDAKDGD